MLDCAYYISGNTKTYKDKKKKKKMGWSSFLRSPKHEEQEQEQQVPHDTNESSLQLHPETIHGIMDDLEGFLGIEDNDEDEKFLCNNVGVTGGWDLMEWEELAREEGLGHGHNNNNNVVVKSENSNIGFWDEDEEKRLCLNLNLNYQDVMDAWSDRGSLWARDCPLSNGYYMGEVPVMEEEASNRREASVLRYKEKRQCRLFSKKIRYQVRKLNADKRPRLKGRFVKRGGSEM